MKVNFWLERDLICLRWEKDDKSRSQLMDRDDVCGIMDGLNSDTEPRLVALSVSEVLLVTCRSISMYIEGKPIWELDLREEVAKENLEDFLRCWLRYTGKFSMEGVESVGMA